MDITEQEYIKNLKPVELSSLNKTSSVYIAKIDTNDSLKGSIFKDIKLSKDVPFASYNNFSKIYREYTPPSTEWINKTDDILIYYNKTIMNSPSDDYQYDEFYDPYYGVAKIEFFKDYGMVISFQYDVYKLHKSSDEVLALLQTTLGTVFKDIAEKDISSMFDIPNQTIEKYIFLDMITNDDKFQQYLTVDESLQTKKSYLTVRFYPETGKSFTFTLTPQFEVSFFLRVKIKGFQTASKVEELRNILSRIITHYNQNSTRIKQLYESYDLTPVSDIESTKDRPRPAPKTSSILKGKSRICGKKQQPTIYETKEEAMINMEDKSENKVMKFPIDSPKYFICTNPDFPYPGIRKNSDVPCCFKKPQVNVSNSAYTLFMKGDKSSTVATTPHVLKGGKILEDNQQGLLPDNLLSFFGKFLKTKDQIFMRYGVKKGPRSFLDSVSKAKPIIEEVYYDAPHLAKQEMYDYSSDDIVNILKDQMKYLDPLMFSNLVGQIEQLNIFMFNEDGMILPRFKYGYYTFKNTYKSIILYEQKLPSDDTSRWEIIALTQGKDVKFIFDDDITSELKSMFFSLTSININSKIIKPELYVKFPDNWELEGQMFDSYGKVRVLKLKRNTDNVTITFHTTPLAPFNCPEINVNYIEVFDSNRQILFEEFVNDMQGAKIVTKNESEIRYEINNEFEISIPVSMQSSSIGIPVSKSSKLRSYITSKRIARYLIEYSLWLFSKHEDKSNVDRFADEKFKIINDYNYNNITKMFDENTGIMKDGKIILNSEDCKKRLKFILKIVFKRTPELFEKYKEYTEIPEYYKDLTDFKKNMTIPVSKDKIMSEHDSIFCVGDNLIKYLINEN